MRPNGESEKKSPNQEKKDPPKQEVENLAANASPSAFQPALAFHRKGNSAAVEDDNQQSPGENN